MLISKITLALSLAFKVITGGLANAVCVSVGRKKECSFYSSLFCFSTATPLVMAGFSVQKRWYGICTCKVGLKFKN